MGGILARLAFRLSFHFSSVSETGYIRLEKTVFFILICTISMSRFLQNLWIN